MIKRPCLVLLFIWAGLSVVSMLLTQLMGPPAQSMPLGRLLGLLLIPPALAAMSVGMVLGRSKRFRLAKRLALLLMPVPPALLALMLMHVRKTGGPLDVMKYYFWPAMIVALTTLCLLAAASLAGWYHHFRLLCRAAKKNK